MFNQQVGSGSPVAGTQAGQPTTLYDAAANRWARAREALDDATQQARDASEVLAKASEDEAAAWRELKAAAGRDEAKRLA